jgi:hypothetical protein
MTFPKIFAYLTHRSSYLPPDNRCASCFDEDQTPVWAYRCEDLATDVRRDPFVLARVRVIMPSGRKSLHAGQVLSHIGLDLEIGGHHIRLQDVELSVIASPALPDLSAPLAEPPYSTLSALVG